MRKPGNPNDIETMLTSSEVAHLLGVHVNTVRKWNNQGIIKAYRIGSRGDRRFRRQDISRFLTKGGQTHPTKEKG